MFRADEIHTSLQGKVNALDALERERVGLAPAAARLLREREQFGDGAILGPLSDFISADQASALLVERFLGATVHAVLVRDRGVAEAVRSWHNTAHPGPLLLLPLDALRGDGVGSDVENALSHRVDATGPGQDWVRALLGHAHAVDEGAAFIDARGAVWLPGSVSGPGPLRRRAELFALRAGLSVTSRARQEAMTAADALRAAVQKSERQVMDASASLEAAQVEARRAAGDGRARSPPAAPHREVEEADARERLSGRRNQLTETLARLDQESGTLNNSLTAARRGTSARDDDGGRAGAGSGPRSARRRRWRRRRRRRASGRTGSRASPVQEHQTANARLDTLRTELSDLSQADSALAEQMAEWQIDLETRSDAGRRRGTLGQSRGRRARD